MLDTAAVRIEADTRQGERDAARAGERLGRAFTAGVNRTADRAELTSQLTVDVESASARVRAARNAESDAVQRVLATERDLTRVRAAATSTADDITKAEKQLDGALRDLATAQTRVTIATGQHTDAQRKLSEETNRNTSVLARLRAALRGVADDSSGGRALTAFAGAARDTDSPLRRLLGNLSLLGTAAQGLKLFLTPTLFAELIPPLLGLGAALVAASGSLLILPGLLAALGVSFGVVKLATSGFGDALKNAFKNIDDPAKVTEALKDLTPAAQEAARAVIGLKKPFDEFRKGLQETFFRGLAAEITATGSTLINTFRPSFQSVAATANTTLKGILTDLRGVREQADLRLIGSSSATAFSNLTVALRPLLKAFLDIAAVGAKVFADITGGAGAAAQKFADFVARIKESGRLEEVIRGGLESLRQMGQIAGNLGSVLASMFRVSAVDGKTFLESLRDGTKALADFAKSVPGQELFGAFFTVLRDLQSALSEVKIVAPAITPVLQALHVGLQALFAPLPAVVAGIRDLLIALAPLLPLAGQVGGAIASGIAVVFRDLAPIVADIVTGIRGLVTNAMPGLISGFTLGWQATKPLLEALGQLALVILPPLGTLLGGIAAVLGPFLPLIVGIAAAFKVYGLAVTVITAATKAWAAIQVVLDALLAASPIGVVILALVALGVAIFAVVQHWDEIKVAAGAAFDAISGFFTSLPGLVSGALSSLGSLIASAASTAWDFLWNTLPDAISTAVGFLASLPQTAAFQLGGLAGQVVNGATAAWGFLWSTIPDAINAVVGFLASLPGLALNALASLPGVIGNAAVTAWNGFINATTAGANNAVSFIAGIPGRIIGFFADTPNWLYNAGANIIRGLINGLRDAAQAVFDYIADLGSRVAAGFAAATGIGSPSRVFADFGRNLGQGLIQGIARITPATEDAARRLALAVTRGGSPDVSDLLPRLGATVGRSAVGALSADAQTLAAGITNTIIINNPVGERSTDSVNRELRKFAALGGFAR